jgi:hypothetical protein
MVLLFSIGRQIYLDSLSVDYIHGFGIRFGPSFLTDIRDEYIWNPKNKSESNSSLGEDKTYKVEKS